MSAPRRLRPFWAENRGLTFLLACANIGRMKKPLPKQKISKGGTTLYLVYNNEGQPVYVSIPE